MGQLAIFDRADEPALDVAFSRVQRIDLADGAWIDFAPGWLAGHSWVFAQLLQRAEWRVEKRVMYEKEVEVPRLLGAWIENDRSLPIIEQMRGALDGRYGTSFTRTSFALYRNGEDSVAWHGDYVAREMDRAIVATVSVGAPRRFLLRRKGGGKSIAWSLGWGDLLVMGGTCQRTYQHAIPKVRHAEPRIAIMFRPDRGAESRTERAPTAIE